MKKVKFEPLIKAIKQTIDEKALMVLTTERKIFRDEVHGDYLEIRLQWFDKKELFRQHHDFYKIVDCDIEEASKKVLETMQQARKGKWMPQWLRSFEKKDYPMPYQSFYKELYIFRTRSKSGVTTLDSCKQRIAHFGEKEWLLARDIVMDVTISGDINEKRRSFTFLKAHVILRNVYYGTQTALPRDEILNIVKRVKLDIDDMVLENIQRFLNLYNIEAPVNILELNNCIYTRGNCLVYTFGIKGQGEVDD